MFRMVFKKVKVAINGFGRIGRAFFKLAHENKEIKIVVINDLGDPETLAYLLRYDSVYGKSDLDIHVLPEGALDVDGKKIMLLSEKDPARLPWGELDIDVVVESTGVFETLEKARAHTAAGAKRVVITAPAKDDTGEGSATVLVGVNEERLRDIHISSNASCTTNACGGLLAILEEGVGVEKAILNTVHAYTATQSLVDSPAKGDLRRGRAAAQNVVPSSTGAAIATTRAVQTLAGKFDGIAIRVPVAAGSIADVTFVAKRNTSKEEINDILTRAAGEERWKGIFSVTEEPLVSSDIIGNTHASVADLAMTRVVGGNLVKILCWYDNEMGYAQTLLLHVLAAGQGL